MNKLTLDEMVEMMGTMRLSPIQRERCLKAYIRAMWELGDYNQMLPAIDLYQSNYHTKKQKNDKRH